MTSRFSSGLSKTLNPSSKSRSNQPRQSAVHDGRMSFNSDCSTLLNVEFPASALKAAPKFDEHIIQVDDGMLDPEDQAWGSPPPSSYKFSLPKFSRRKNNSRS